MIGPSTLTMVETITKCLKYDKDVLELCVELSSQVKLVYSSHKFYYIRRS